MWSGEEGWGQVRLGKVWYGFCNNSFKFLARSAPVRLGRVRCGKEWHGMDFAIILNI